MVNTARFIHGYVIVRTPVSVGDKIRLLHIDGREYHAEVVFVVESTDGWMVSCTFYLN